MVSTRRTAVTSSESNIAHDAVPTLRKKAVRKAAATIEPEIPKPRATRARKAELALEAESAIEDVSESQEVIRSVPSPRRAVRKTPARSSKATAASAPQSQPTKVPTEAVNLGKPTRASTTRSRKAEAVAKEPEEQPLRDAAKVLPIQTSRQPRGAAAPKVPLSPKKVSQVNRIRRPTTKLADKAIEKASSAKPPGKRRGITRSRAISDENADSTCLPLRNEDDTVAALPIATEESHTAVERLAALSESSMSSRPTTPSYSPMISFGDVESHHELEADEGDETEDDLMANYVYHGTDHLDTSDDELAGPKTPMKRSSPGAQARYLASTQKTIRRLDDDVPAKIPGQNLDRTPEGLKLPATSSATSMVTQKMDVPRPSGMPPPSQSIQSHQNLENCLGVIEKDDAEEEEEDEDHDVENYKPQDGWTDRNDHSHDDDSLLLDTPYRKGRSSSFASLSSGNVSISGDETIAIADVEPANYEGGESNDTHDVHDSAIEQEHDSECVSTYTSGEFEDHGSTKGASTSDSDYSVNMRRDENDASSTVPEENERLVEAEISASNGPQTLIWANIRDDVTIPINFDQHFSSVRSLPQIDQTACLNTAIDVTPLAEGVTQTQPSICLPASPFPELQDVQQTASIVDRRTTLDTFNEFVDIDAGECPAETVQAKNSCAEEVLTESPAGGKHARHVVSKAAAEDESRMRKHLDDPHVTEVNFPHYALPTMAFAARRKSLPATSIRTPVRFGSRPHTSDGASMPRSVGPDQRLWWARVVDAYATPVRSRSRTALHTASIATHRTPIRQNLTAVEYPSRSARPSTRYQLPVHTRACTEHANTVAAPARFRTPGSSPVSRPSTAHKSSRRTEAPLPLSLRLRQSQPLVAPSAVAARSGDSKLSIEVKHGEEVATPVQDSSKPLRRRNYDAFAKTLATTRHRTPVQSPPKRPVTAIKPAISRKVTFSTSTPTKTPLKGPGMTPGQIPMTPHPAAPLRNITALVEVFTLEGASASAPFIALLKCLGARAQKSWSERITHVIFKDGSPRTLQRLRLHNQAVEQTGHGHRIHCVNSRWVSDCDAEGVRMPETDEAYAVDPTIIPRGGSRRRKSMEPYALVSIGGNIVRGDRKSSLGRQSLSRALSPAKLVADTPVTRAFRGSLVATPEAHFTPPSSGYAKDQENVDLDGLSPSSSSPATPAWLHPEQLVQQTAPINRVRKLEIKSSQQGKNRRLTFWNGGA